MDADCKSDLGLVEETNMEMHSTFCTTANHLSKMYAQATEQHKKLFEAGKRHTLRRQEGAEVTMEEFKRCLEMELHLGPAGTSVIPGTEAPQSTPGPNSMFPNAEENSISYNELLSPISNNFSFEMPHLMREGSDVFRTARLDISQSSFTPQHNDHGSNALQVINGSLIRELEMNEVPSCQEQRDTGHFPGR